MNINRTPSRIFCTAAIREAATCLGADAGDFSEELYTEFARSGNRIHYEAANFHRRRLLNRLALGELCEGGGRFLPELERIIDCTLNERSWVLPAHSSGKLPQGAETNIDLFSSQTAAALAMISARLPLTDTLQKRIWETIDARIFQPFLAHDYWWRDLGKNRREVPSNWTPWCIHGVLECVRAVVPDALPWCDGDFSWGGFADTELQRANHPVRLIPFSDGSTFRPETRRQLPLASFLPPGHLPQLTEIAQSCLVSLHNYFEDYPDDGGCDEGAQYWEHSVGHFFECGLWQQFDTAKLCAMYSFISKVHMTGNYYMNFADCAARIFPNASMIFLMGTAGRLPELAGFGAFLHQTCMAAAPDPTLRDNMDFRAILNAALASCAIETYMDMPVYRGNTMDAGKPRRIETYMDMPVYRPDAHDTLPGTPLKAQTDAPARHQTGQTIPPDTSMELCTTEPFHRPQDQFASLDAGIFRRRHFCVAAKGGHNAENHNHNDCGNVIVYAGGLPILIDAGVGAYTKDTFSERRYTIWTMQSSYHNLPEINGCMQRDGREYCATPTTFSEDTFFCECHHAYPGEAGLSYFSRSANVGEKFVKLTSKFSFEKEENHLALNYMLAEKPELADCRARVNGCILKLPKGKWSVETIEFGEDEKLSPVWGHCVYRLRGEIDVLAKEFTAVTIIECDSEKSGAEKDGKTPEYTVILDADSPAEALSSHPDNCEEKNYPANPSGMHGGQTLDSPSPITYQTAASESDIRFMKQALEQAKKATAAGDVPIGCVIVHNGEIIASAYNMRNQDTSVLAHAETLAIEKAAKKCRDFRLEDCTLYVTLEPCPMCAGAIVQARIPRVVIGTMNPKAGCAGSILNILQNPRLNHQTDITAGVCRGECSALLSDFFRELRNADAQE